MSDLAAYDSVILRAVKEMENSIESPQLTGTKQTTSTTNNTGNTGSSSRIEQDASNKSNGNDAGSSQASNTKQEQEQPRSRKYQKPTVVDEEEENDDVMKYARKEGGLALEEFQKKGLQEMERIKYCSADDVEELWGIDPADLDRGKRNLHLKLLMRLVHSDKHPDASEEQKADLNAAFNKLKDTEKYVDNPSKKDISTGKKKRAGHAIPPVGPQYLSFYNQVNYLQALETLFRNPNNEPAIRLIEMVNDRFIKLHNQKTDQKPMTGQVPIRELVQFYARAHNAIEGFDEANEEEKSKRQADMAKVFEESRIYCEGCGLPRSFSSPSPDCNRVPTFWRNSDKNRESVDDGMETADSFREKQNSRDPGTAGAGSGPSDADHSEARAESSSRQDSGAGSTDRKDSVPGSSESTDVHISGTSPAFNSSPQTGGSSGGVQGATEAEAHQKTSPVQSSFELARQHKMTFDGKRMLAAKKVASKNWAIIVNEGTEEVPYYRFRSGNGCGGKTLLHGIVEQLPRLDKVSIKEEKEAEDSRFTRLLGIAQLGTQTYCYTSWAGKDPFWISRTKLSERLGSGPMVDQMVQELGAELSTSDSMTAMIPQAGRLGMAYPRRLILKHRAFPAPSLNAVAHQLSSLRL